MKRTDFYPSKAQLYAALALSLAVCALLPESAYAGVPSGTNSPMGDALCYAVSVVFGNFGRALATIAIISIGIGAMLGKVSWGLAITVTTGIAIVFNSYKLLAIVGIQGTGCQGF